MKLTKKTIELVCELEKIIGNQCYNPNSLNGYTWEEGCEFRYPVNYVNKEGNEIKSRGLVHEVNKDGINSMHYKFGSNELFIGNAIVKALELIEDKYGIDFNELVKAKKTK